MSDSFDWIHRDRGVLTERDREILIGEAGEDLTENAVNQRYYNIRSRIKNAIYDFYLLSQYLPVTDIRQIFEPAYTWSREQRQLSEQGLTSASPELSPLLWGWLGVVELFSYGLYAGGKQETQLLMQDLIETGLERGFRQYLHDTSQLYQEIEADLSIKHGNPVLRENYFRDIGQHLSDDPSEIAKEIMLLERQRKIPRDVASQWINELVRTQDIE